MARGYRKVSVQHSVGRYRIDIVVEGPHARLAAECDGDRWHGPDVWHKDRARQQVLERANWTFERIRGSAFYRGPEEVAAQSSLRPWRCGRHGIGYAVNVKYQPLTLADLARLVAGERDFDSQWRLVVEFLKEYHQEPAGVRLCLLEDAPGPVGDERWDVLFAGLAEHLAMRDGQAAPGWSAARGLLRRFWFPFDAPGARAQALVHAPAAFRRRGVFVADYEIDAA